MFFTAPLRATRPAQLALFIVTLITFLETYMMYEVFNYVIFFVILLLPFS